ncbi:hypothetical protein HZS_2944 [Henneguya salminicola]|nr:hypothetical protein HZS_2944 [Henneguya salminicola]
MSTDNNTELSEKNIKSPDLWFIEVKLPHLFINYVNIDSLSLRENHSSRNYRKLYFFFKPSTQFFFLVSLDLFKLRKKIGAMLRLFSMPVPAHQYLIQIKFISVKYLSPTIQVIIKCRNIKLKPDISTCLRLPTNSKAMLKNVNSHYFEKKYANFSLSKDGVVQVNLLPPAVITHLTSVYEDCLQQNDFNVESIAKKFRVPIRDVYMWFKRQTKFDLKS